MLLLVLTMTCRQLQPVVEASSAATEAVAALWWCRGHEGVFVRVVSSCLRSVHGACTSVPCCCALSGRVTALASCTQCSCKQRAKRCGKPLSTAGLVWKLRTANTSTCLCGHASILQHSATTQQPTCCWRGARYRGGARCVLLRSQRAMAFSVAHQNTPNVGSAMKAALEPTVKCVRKNCGRGCRRPGQ